MLPARFVLIDPSHAGNVGAAVEGDGLYQRVNDRESRVRHYCILILRSNAECIPAAFFKPSAMKMLEFDDNDSAFNVARLNRWREKIGDWFPIRNDLFLLRRKLIVVMFKKHCG